MRSFASDNNTGVHPEILKAIVSANEGHAVAYGDDPYTERAIATFKKHFGKNIEVFFVFNGTAANVLSLKALTKSYQGILCSKTSHIHNDECGAPELFTGCKLIPIETSDGKLTTEKLGWHLQGVGDQHHVQPGAVSITQSTELGTVYSVEEIREISKFCRENNLYLHMDGARAANGAVSLGTELRAFTADAGVDVLSFGGTKNGLLGAEAVVFFKPELARDFKFIRKQAMQLSSKMRFIAVQFEALFAHNLWKTNAETANRMAQRLAKEISIFPQLEITQKVQANGVFVKIPPPVISKLRENFFFYTWDEKKSEVRWMTSFDTTEQDILDFVSALKLALN